MKPIGVKWVFKTKLNEKGEVDKYKRCLGRGEVVFLVRGTPLHEGRDFVGLVEHRYFGGRCVKTL